MPVYAHFTPSGTLISQEARAPALGEMNFVFFDVGQGDCTMISLPDNRVIVVDCGSVGGMPVDGMTKVRAKLRSWANGNSIDMILSHPDIDHYNKVIDLVQQYLSPAQAAVQVRDLYFSWALNNNSPLGNYASSNLGGNMHILQNPSIYEVTVNAVSRTKKKWDNSNNYGASTATSVIPADGLTVTSGNSNGTAWSVKIIAGNVPAQGNDEWKSNAGSLVTLVQFGTNKVLLMADSTEETMDYLEANQSGQIGNVAMFQMPHHGSESNLPPDNFKARVNPQAITVSVGLLTSGHKLPRYNAIEKWKDGTRLRGAALQMDYWIVGAPDYKTYDDLKTILDNKWKGYKVDNNVSRTFFWLKNPADAGPAKSKTGFYGFSNNGYFLYRVTLDKDIWATGVEGTSKQKFP